MMEHYVTAVSTDDLSFVVVGCRCGYLLVCTVAEVQVEWARHAIAGYLGTAGDAMERSIALSGAMKPNQDVAS